MVAGPIHMAYILAALLFIIALAGLSKQETAKYGCLSGMVGMTIALLATFAQVGSATGFLLIVVAMCIGAGIGIFVARRVAMTQMPEMIACLHSFVGLAAVLVGYNSFLELGAIVPDTITVPLDASQATIVAMMDAAKQAADERHLFEHVFREVRAGFFYGFLFGFKDIAFGLTTYRVDRRVDNVRQLVAGDITHGVVENVYRVECRPSAGDRFIQFIVQPTAYSHLEQHTD